ncbi:MAG: hypothetical protein A4E19_19360 [Nitrospira sp. SG-bin1]|nr:MAG: hypothetical protein A4E19_19360 [Nitrospira sp. SG-bin1]
MEWVRVLEVEREKEAMVQVAEQESETGGAAGAAAKGPEGSVVAVMGRPPRTVRKQPQPKPMT